MNKITIAEVLKGTVAGRMQSVGYMQIIPLISDLVDDAIGAPSFHSSTSDYGSLTVENKSPKDSILPFAAGFISKQAAQNHAVTKAKLVSGGRRSTINTAACIQSSQGGTIAHGDHQMTILPWIIREHSQAVKDVRKYSKLWPAIEEFNQNLGLQKRGHLEDYLNKFDKELSTFIAEFEVVPKQVGAIILMNGFVVGVERAPNYEYWNKIWKPLIRECYGSLAIQYKKNFGANPPPPKTRVPLKSVNVRSLAGIKKALKSARVQEDGNVKTIVRKFIKNQFNRTEEEKAGNLVVESLNHNQFFGQIVRRSESILYASLSTSGSWKQDQSWNEADEFKL